MILAVYCDLTKYHGHYTHCAVFRNHLDLKRAQLCLKHFLNMPIFPAQLMARRSEIIKMIEVCKMKQETSLTSLAATKSKVEFFDPLDDGSNGGET